tara:strand:+ start:4489 stop:5526 length:1038 start_codon:yes stop_codon:yes gene_type:complete
MRRLTGLLIFVLVACGTAEPPEATDPGEAQEPGVTEALPIKTVPVWIDTDPSIRLGGYEVDDGFALIQSFHSPELSIRGVSLVFGNAPLEVEIPIGREIVNKFGPSGLEVTVGAESVDQLGESTEASRALADALRQDRLTILALGPATNIGTVLLQEPELADQIVEVVAVAGRRPGQIFSTGSTSSLPFCDCNFDKDPRSFQIILDAGVPLTLTPWELSSQIWLSGPDLDQLEQGSGSSRYLVASARDWLALWNERFGVHGFNPFDTLAVGYLTTAQAIACERLPVEIIYGPDDRSVAAGDQDPADKPYLVVDVNSHSTYSTTYCHTPTAAFKDDLMQRLLGGAS